MTYSYNRITYTSRSGRNPFHSCTDKPGLTLEKASKMLVNFLKRKNSSSDLRLYFSGEVYAECSQVSVSSSYSSEAWIARDDKQPISEEEFTEIKVRVRDLMRETPEGFTYRKRKSHPKYHELFQKLIYKHKIGGELAEAIIQATFLGKVVCPCCYRRMEKVYNEDLRRMEWICNTPEFYYGEEGYLCNFHTVPIIVVALNSLLEN